MFFIKQFLKSPFTIGSICPSSRALSQALVNMAFESYPAQHGLIIDLGAGTGVVTRELLALGVAPEEILAIDISANFQGIFRKHCSPLSLHVADARDLYPFISRNYPGIPILAIISSLPLRNMLQTVICEIMAGIWQALDERGGILVQYTYALWNHASLSQYGFALKSSRYIIKNLPPTLVEKYWIKST